MRTDSVAAWMTPNPIYITPYLSVSEARQLMEERHIRHLPVMDEGNLLGMITRGDIRSALALETTDVTPFGMPCPRCAVDGIMSRDIATVTPNTAIGEAASLMLQYKIAGLPVLEDGRLVGIITESDILRILVNEWKQAEAIQEVHESLEYA